MAAAGLWMTTGEGRWRFAVTGLLDGDGSKGGGCAAAWRSLGLRFVARRRCGDWWRGVEVVIAPLVARVAEVELRAGLVARRQTKSKVAASTHVTYSPVFTVDYRLPSLRRPTPPPPPPPSSPPPSTIAIVAGHYIDPGTQVGAPGERDFNMRIADTVERQLRQAGWMVLRPEKEEHGLTWEGYQRWCSGQCQKGVPVVEIHGQGGEEEKGEAVLGVIGREHSALNLLLAEKFGSYPLESYRTLAVPRNGGAIVEAFDTDEVLRGDENDRRRLVQRISGDIVGAVQALKTRMGREAEIQHPERGCSPTGCPFNWTYEEEKDPKT